jgi:hypothetical protein
VIDLPPGRRTARLWGQVRPGGVHEVTLLRRLSGQADFSPFATVMTNAAGYFARTEVIDPGAEYRYSWLADAAGSASAVPEERRSGIVDLRLRAARSQRAAAATAP